MRTSPEKERIGLYFGTFDPVHVAHLLLAETAREAIRLDRVIFMPAGVPPNKLKKKVTPGEIRFEMLRRATADNPRLEVSRLEIDAPGLSYTVDTLRLLKRRYPGAKLFFIAGSDTINDLPNWYMPQEICRLVSLVTALRPGDELPDFDRLGQDIGARLPAAVRRQVIPMPLLEISSTEIRRLRAQGKSIRYRTPDKVIAVIEKYGLYQKKARP
ncbi:MAG: nicotinate-nucleotide adenylyltransferase [Thermoguttaceae bacterium]|nr:nicotinate-nucleotide adenylyltransferase [Thermoguttaceae bacterium]MBQ6619289.1 nicotinate-nucleotide adenylyltransferase [Thermoguttaceae bacterium]